MEAGQPMVHSEDLIHIPDLIYFAVFALVVGFTTYPLFVARIGSVQVGYAMVTFPVFALLVSTLFKNQQ